MMRRIAMRLASAVVVAAVVGAPGCDRVVDLTRAPDAAPTNDGEPPPDTVVPPDAFAPDAFAPDAFAPDAFVAAVDAGVDTAAGAATAPAAR